jgi:hypothetical protein
MSLPQTTLRKQDATNRAVRTFIQGLAIDMGVALAVLLWTIFSQANSWGDLEWKIIAFSVLKTILTSIASFVMRRFVDKAGSTALPPDDPGRPSDSADPPDLRGGNL